MEHVEKSRVVFEVPINIHHTLKKCAIDLGISVREFATQAIMEKIEALEYEQDCKDGEAAYNRFKKNGSKTISHEDMMKRLGWDDVQD